MSNVGIGNVVTPQLVPGMACAVLVSALALAAPAPSRAEPPKLPEIGRASCRERV